MRCGIYFDFEARSQYSLILNYPLLGFTSEFRAPPQPEKNKEGEKNLDRGGGGTKSSERSPTEGKLNYSENSKIDQHAGYDGPAFDTMDIRVGKILRCWDHEEADKLFCEEIDVGEDEPRMIASGLKPFFDSSADLEGRKVLVLCNLKARKLVGFPSHGMVLCASSEDHSTVKFVSPPADAKIGERVVWR